MKTNLIILIPLLALTACGKDGEQAQSADNTVEVASNGPGASQGNSVPTVGTNTGGDTTPTTPTTPTSPANPTSPSEESEPEEEGEPEEENTIEVCEITDLNQTIAGTCQSVQYGNTLLAGSTQSQETVTIVASKRNGGSGGSRWFNSSLQLSQATALSLPEELTAAGNGGNGHHVYILINGSIDCVWTSHGAHRYRNPVCKMGATRNPSDSTGFSGGTSVATSAIPAVSRLEMTVNGSQGNGVLTTVTAVFTIQ